MFKYLYLTAAFVFCLLSAFAQKKESIVFDHLNAGKGFPAKFVQAIRQAPNGQLWMLSDKGLLKYNGQGGKIYPAAKDTSSIGLLPLPLLQLYVDKKGILWISYVEAAISSFDPVSEKFTHYYHRKKDKKSFPQGAVVNFMEDSKGNFWMANWGGGLIRLDKKTAKFEIFQPDLKNPKAISTTSITDVVEQKDGTLLVSCWEDGIYGQNAFLQTFDYKKKTFVKFPLDDYKTASIQERFALKNAMRIVHFIYLQDPNNIWLGTYVGLIHIDKKAKTVKRVSGLTAAADYKFGLGNLENALGYVVVNNKLWVSTSVEGIMTVDLKTKACKYIHYDPTTTTGIGSNTIFFLFKDKESNVWVSTKGGGIDIYSPLVQQFRLFTNDQLQTQKANRQRDQSTIRSFLNGNHSGYSYILHGNGITVLNRKTDSVFRIDTKELFEKYKHKFGLAVDEFYSQNNPAVPSFVAEARNKLILGFGGCTFLYDLKTKKIELVNKTNNYTQLSEITGKGEFCYFRFNNSNGDHFLDFSTIQNPKITQPVLIPRAKYPDIRGVQGKLIRHLGNDNWFVDGYDHVFYVINSKTKKATIYNSRKGYKNFPDSLISYLTVDPHKNVWMTATRGLYKFDYRTGKSTLMSKKIGIEGEYVNSITIDKNGIFWIALSSDLIKYNPETGERFRFGNKTGLNVGNFAAVSTSPNGTEKIYIPTAYGLLEFNPDKLKISRKTPALFFSSVIINKDTLSEHEKIPFFSGKNSLSWNQNFITFEFGTDQYYSPGPKNYKYRLLGLDSVWYSNKDRNYVSYTNLAPGTYTFEVICENVFGVESNKGNILFTIEAPFWQRWWFIVLEIIAGLSLIYWFIRYRERALNKQKEKLEQTVNERTQEIQHQSEIIQEKNKEVMDSIKYAKRIQQAILANGEIMEQNLPEHFVLFKPKDIVSGDFYWAAQSPKHKNNFFLAICDCTGHGVPGAFMSLLNISFLNEAITEKGIEDPGLILDYVREKLIQNISQEGNRDGMDGTLICFNKETNHITYASAHNKPILIREKEILELKADKMPIGSGEKTDAFTTHELQLQEGDRIYFYTDGYADQFGGEKGKKFKYRPLNELLKMNADLNITEQRSKLEETFVHWKGELEQVDDVLVIGIKI